MPPTVLVTGLSGLIGSLLRPKLEQDYRISALNRSAVSDIPTTRANIADAEAIRPAFDNIDTVIHLAAKAGGQHSWTDFHTTNIVGTFNVLKAASEAGCRRFIYASSGATVAGYEFVDPYRSIVQGDYGNVSENYHRLDHTDAVWPLGVYGSTKVWGEAICRNFADSSHLEVLCVRIGYVNREDRPLKIRDWATWCSNRDIVNALLACVCLASPLKFATFFVNSNNRWGYRDLTHAYDSVQFKPMDEAEAFRD